MIYLLLKYNILNRTVSLYFYLFWAFLYVLYVTAVFVWGIGFYAYLVVVVFPPIVMSVLWFVVAVFKIVFTFVNNVWAYLCNDFIVAKFFRSSLENYMFFYSTWGEKGEDLLSGVDLLYFKFLPFFLILVVVYLYVFVFGIIIFFWIGNSVLNFFTVVVLRNKLDFDFFYRYFMLRKSVVYFVFHLLEFVILGTTMSEIGGVLRVYVKELNKTPDYYKKPMMQALLKRVAVFTKQEFVTLMKSSGSVRLFLQFLVFVFFKIYIHLSHFVYLIYIKFFFKGNINKDKKIFSNNTYSILYPVLRWNNDLWGWHLLLFFHHRYLYFYKIYARGIKSDWTGYAKEVEYTKIKSVLVFLRDVVDFLGCFHYYKEYDFNVSDSSVNASEKDGKEVKAENVEKDVKDGKEVKAENVENVEKDVKDGKEVKAENVEKDGVDYFDSEQEGVIKKEKDEIDVIVDRLLNEWEVKENGVVREGRVYRITWLFYSVWPEELQLRAYSREYLERSLKWFRELQDLRNQYYDAAYLFQYVAKGDKVVYKKLLQDRGLNFRLLDLSRYEPVIRTALYKMIFNRIAATIRVFLHFFISLFDIFFYKTFRAFSKIGRDDLLVYFIYYVCGVLPVLVIGMCYFYFLFPLIVDLTIWFLQKSIFLVYYVFMYVPFYIFLYKGSVFVISLAGSFVFFVLFVWFMIFSFFYYYTYWLFLSSDWVEGLEFFPYYLPLFRDPFIGSVVSFFFFEIPYNLTYFWEIYLNAFFDIVGQRYYTAILNFLNFLYRLYNFIVSIFVCEWVDFAVLHTPSPAYLEIKLFLLYMRDCFLHVTFFIPLLLWYVTIFVPFIEPTEFSRVMTVVDPFAYIYHSRRTYMPVQLENWGSSEWRMNRKAFFRYLAREFEPLHFVYLFRRNKHYTGDLWYIYTFNDSFNFYIILDLIVHRYGPDFDVLKFLKFLFKGNFVYNDDKKFSLRETDPFGEQSFAIFRLFNVFKNFYYFGDFWNYFQWRMDRDKLYLYTLLPSPSSDNDVVKYYYNTRVVKYFKLYSKSTYESLNLLRSLKNRDIDTNVFLKVDQNTTWWDSVNAGFRPMLNFLFMKPVMVPSINNLAEILGADYKVFLHKLSREEIFIDPFPNITRWSKPMERYGVRPEFWWQLAYIEMKLDNLYNKDQEYEKILARSMVYNSKLFSPVELRMVKSAHFRETTLDRSYSQFFMEFFVNFVSNPELTKSFPFLPAPETTYWRYMVKSHSRRIVKEGRIDYFYDHMLWLYEFFHPIKVYLRLLSVQDVQILERGSIDAVDLKLKRRISMYRALVLRRLDDVSEFKRHFIMAINTYNVHVEPILKMRSYYKLLIRNKFYGTKFIPKGKEYRTDPVASYRHNQIRTFLYNNSPTYNYWFRYNLVVRHLPGPVLQKYNLDPNKKWFNFYLRPHEVEFLDKYWPALHTELRERIDYERHIRYYFVRKYKTVIDFFVPYLIVHNPDRYFVCFGKDYTEEFLAKVADNLKKRYELMEKYNYEPVVAYLQNPDYKGYPAPSEVFKYIQRTELDSVLTDEEKVKLKER